MIGQTIGDYQVLALLGSGGMGAVYEALHAQIGKHVAIKILHPSASQNPEVARRFVDEARAVNIVDHPGLVQIFDFGQLSNHTTYIVMELLKGESLSDRIRGGRLDPSDAVRLGLQLALAVGAAHERKIIHRDLKPANIMIIPDPVVPGGERTKILDFGIAKLAAEHRDRRSMDTESGIIMGTPTYMSPEQCRGAGRVTSQTDVYSLGVILYYILAGGAPFVGDGHGDIIAQHLTALPRPLWDFVPDVPQPLSELVHRMLAKAPEERPRMDEVAGKLEGLDARLNVSPSNARTLPIILLDEEFAPDEPSSLSGQTSIHAGRLSRGWLISLSLGAGMMLAVGGGMWLPRRHGGTSGQMDLVGAPGIGRARQGPPISAAQPPVDALKEGPAQPVVERPAATREQVHWSITTRPAGATVLRQSDGQKLGQTPWTYDEDLGEGSVSIVLRRAGFADRVLALPLATDFTREERLVPTQQKVKKQVPRVVPQDKGPTPPAQMENKDVPIFSP